MTIRNELRSLAILTIPVLAILAALVFTGPLSAAPDPKVGSPMTQASIQPVLIGDWGSRAVSAVDALRATVQSSYLDALQAYGVGHPRLLDPIYLQPTQTPATNLVKTYGGASTAVVLLYAAGVPPQDRTDGYCAYHNWITINRSDYPYAVVREPSGDCAGSRLSVATSHEIVEMLSDPAVQGASGGSVEEIADICEHDPSTVLAVPPTFDGIALAWYWVPGRGCSYGQAASPLSSPAAP